MQPLLQWKINTYYTFGVCICSLRYPACIAHAPYCHLLPAWLHSIFPHNLINGKTFEKKVTKHKMCVRISSTTFVWNTSHFRKIWARYDKNLHWFSCKGQFIISDINETWIFWQIFEKYSNIKFRENPSSESRGVPCGQTDRHDEANSRFSQFCERA